MSTSTYGGYAIMAIGVAGMVYAGVMLTQTGSGSPETATTAEATLETSVTADVTDLETGTEDSTADQADAADVIVEPEETAAADDPVDATEDDEARAAFGAGPGPETDPIRESAPSTAPSTFGDMPSEIAALAPSPAPAPALSPALSPALPSAPAPAAPALTGAPAPASPSIVPDPTPGTGTVAAITPDLGGIKDDEPEEGEAVLDALNPDPIMAAAIRRARDTLPDLLDKMMAPPAGTSGYSIKVAVPTETAFEQMWMDNCQPDGRRLMCQAANDGLETGLKIGDPYRVNTDMIADWMYLEGEGIHGGYTLRLMLQNMEPEQADALRSRLRPLPG